MTDKIKLNEPLIKSDNEHISIPAKPESAENFIILDARGKQIKVPETVLVKSKVFKDLILKMEGKYNKVIYINRNEKDVHNLINFMSDYDYEETKELFAMIEENLIDCEQVDMRLFKLDETASSTWENYRVYHITREQISKSFMNRIMNYLKKSYDIIKCETEKKEVLTNYIFKCYNKNDISAIYEANLKAHDAYIRTNITDVSIIIEIAKDVIKKLRVETKYINLYKRIDKDISGHVFPGYDICTADQYATKGQIARNDFIMSIPI